MLPASNRATGSASGFPDTCNTPNGSGVDVPTPYTNTGDHSQSQGYSQTVFVAMMNALNQSSTVSTTSGDESGTSHSTIKGVMSHTVGNAIVFVNSVSAINLTSTTSHNAGNCSSGSVVSPGAANVFYTYRSGVVPALGESLPISAAEFEARGERLAGPSLERMAEGEGGANLRCHVITERTSNELFGLLADVPTSFGVTLDLRGCPGGTLGGAERLLSALLPQGAVLFETVDLDGDVATFVGRPGPRVTHPLTILVDAMTGSAAEVVAESLANHGRATIVGGPTAGKLTAQIVVDHGGSPALATTLRIRTSAR